LKTIVFGFLLFFFFVHYPPHAEAQDMQTSTNTYSRPFVKNRMSAQLVSGALFGPVSWVHDHATFNFAQTNLRIGWMASDPTESRHFGRGNFELLFEVTNSIIFEGWGSYVRGFTLLGRYNLLLSNPKWVPYIQIGAGVVVNDAYEDMRQSEIGQAVEFTPQGSIGLHYFISRQWTLDVEAMFHHISNAGFSDGRNGGINAVGGFFGVTHFFYELWH
jgi:hypothetical protein